MRKLSVIGLFLALCIPAAATPQEKKEEITLDIEPFQKLAQTFQGLRLANEVAQQVHNKAVNGPAAGNDGLVSAMTEIEKWATDCASKIEPAIAPAEACQAQLTRLEAALMKAGKLTVANADGLLGQLAETPDELTFALKKLIENAAAKGKGAPYLEELRASVERLKDIAAWQILELKWIKENAKLATDYLKKNPNAATFFRQDAGLRGLPGVSGLTWVWDDWKEFDRQIEDVLGTSDEDAIIGQACPHPAFRMIAPRLRKFYGALEEKLKKDKRIVEVFRRAWQTPYNVTCLNSLMKAYEGVDVEAKLIDVMRNWAKSNPPDKSPKGQFDEIVTFCDVINFRQGTPLLSDRIEDRFETQLMAEAPKIAGLKREMAFAKAYNAVCGWYKGTMQYGQSPNLAETFKNKKADCINVANMAGCLMADAGYGNVYGVQYMAENYIHWVNTFQQLNGKIITQDFMSGGGDQQNFPESYATPAARGCCTRWVRTVTRGIEWQIVMDSQVFTRQLPYYDWTPPGKPAKGPKKH